MPQPQTELLVHIAAPSHASDDSRYRQLAQSYLSFSPARCISIVAGSSHGSSNAEPRQVVAADDVGCAALGNAAVIEFPSLSFGSVWDNASSLGLALAPVGRSAIRHVAFQESVIPRGGTDDASPCLPRLLPNKTSYVDPDVFIPDSQPENGTCGRRQALSADEVERTVYGTADLLDIPSLDLSMSPSILRPRKQTMKAGSLQSGPRDLVPSPTLAARAPLAQMDANAPSSSQRSSDGDGCALVAKAADRDTIPSSDSMLQSAAAAVAAPALAPVFSSQDDDHVPSSLPEEAGPVMVLQHSGPFGEDTESAALAGSKRKRSVATRTSLLPMTLSASDLEARQPHKRARTSTAMPDVLQIIRDSDGGDDGESQRTDAKRLHSHRSFPPLSLPSSFPATPSPRNAAVTSMRVFAPEPAAACTVLTPDALVTPKLAKLARDLDLARRFRPTTGGRAVGAFERGFWRINTATWPTAVRQRAWAFLAAYVGRGDAGWSVWCACDPGSHHALLRLYCFGAVAGHAYLLLYLASQRQILATGAEWLDGTGTPAISVLPRRRRRESSLEGSGGHHLAYSV